MTATMTTTWLPAVRLDSLQPGQRFRVPADPDYDAPERRGTVIDIGISGCRVVLDAPPATKTFTTWQGKTLTFPKKPRPIRWAGAAMVEPAADA